MVAPPLVLSQVILSLGGSALGPLGTARFQLLAGPLIHWAGAFWPAWTRKELALSWPFALWVYMGQFPITRSFFLSETSLKWCLPSILLPTFCSWLLVLSKKTETLSTTVFFSFWVLIRIVYNDPLITMQDFLACVSKPKSKAISILLDICYSLHVDFWY